MGAKPPTCSSRYVVPCLSQNFNVTSSFVQLGLTPKTKSRLIPEILNTDMCAIVSYRDKAPLQIALLLQVWIFQEQHFVTYDCSARCGKVENWPQRWVARNEPKSRFFYGWLQDVTIETGLVRTDVHADPNYLVPGRMSVLVKNRYSEFRFLLRPFL